VFGLVAMVTPIGTELKSMLWMLLVSLFVKTIVVPAATVSVEGWKFNDMFAPIPLGMMMLAVAPEVVLVIPVLELDVVEVVVDDVVVVLLVGMLDVVVVVVVLVVVEVLEPGTKMKYAAPAMSITTITAAAIAPVPIPLLFCSNFIPSNSPKQAVRVLLLRFCERRVQIILFTRAEMQFFGLQLYIVYNV
jgi:hypothetical protein